MSYVFTVCTGESEHVSRVVCGVYNTHTCLLLLLLLFYPGTGVPVHFLLFFFWYHVPGRVSMLQKMHFLDFIKLYVYRYIKVFTV